MCFGVFFHVDASRGDKFLRKERHFKVEGHSSFIGLDVIPDAESKVYRIWFINADGTKKPGYNGIGFMKRDVEERIESLSRLVTLTEAL